MSRAKLDYCELPKDAKLIPGFDRYYADPLGNIYSKYKNAGYVKMHTHIDSDGYVRCRGYLTVHRLVALTFFGDKPGMEINHKDGNKQNDSITNLEWVTHKENIQHSYDTGLNRVTEERKRKTSEALRGKPLSEERKRKTSEGHKKPIKVIFSDDSELIFNSRNECADFLKVGGSNLSRYIQGKLKVPKRCNVKEIYYL